MVAITFTYLLALVVAIGGQLFGGPAPAPQLFGNWGYNAQGAEVTISPRGVASPDVVTETRNGVSRDAFGNVFEGDQNNGLYLFCSGHGCPGRG